jgi:hypothetical protein
MSAATVLLATQVQAQHRIPCASLSARGDKVDLTQGPVGGALPVFEPSDTVSASIDGSRHATDGRGLLRGRTRHSIPNLCPTSTLRIEPEYLPVPVRIASPRPNPPSC